MSLTFSPLSIEDRLLIIRSHLDALRAIAHLVDRPTTVPLPGCITPGESHRAFTKWVALMVESLDEQVRAICAALPEPVVTLNAPLGGGQR